MIVYDVHAEDPDRGSNGIIDYGFFVGGVFTNQTAEFHINSITGVISARIVYDREQVPRYTVCTRLSLTSVIFLHLLRDTVNSIFFMVCQYSWISWPISNDEI